MTRIVRLLSITALLLAVPAFAAQKKAGNARARSDSGKSKVLEQALKLHESGDFYSASIQLNKVIEGETGDSETNRHQAEFWMGKALYNLKFYSAALSYFDRIVQKGPAHHY